MPAALTLSLDAALRARLDAAAAERDMTPEAMAECAVLDFLEAGEDPPPLQDWQAAAIEDGIAAADRGDFASPGDVDRIFAKHRS